MNSNKHKLVLVVACVLIRDDRSVLITQRPAGKLQAGLWEFPGGKVESGETPEKALVRELIEELSITIQEISLFPLTFASYAYDDFHLLMPLFGCVSFQGIPYGREGQKIQWVQSHDLYNFPMPLADKPLVLFLQNFLLQMKFES
ncbi:5-methyl-dCTP pyrophosphohydrolase [Liberibacter crescens BT-1]|uniref:8-oxo-dGTP diphosphatase n=1 Tax=Liberibacter crescens (strain BT-1) TaxID=1215343 RepID=L0ETZ4_LIBCB|nr:(deoxy)nucleoside triphosphate pyrophosphohydrolase [Liberibacter crescens]AGA64325.1 5-methyl-dCTP pyrophosphohydrolase [Liberibacter crescens BT-1]AMC12534.1 NTP pyrophosphohydrolase [Liberibacter crescens]